MAIKNKLRWASIFVGLVLFAGLISSPSPLLAQDVVVSQAAPSDAPQGTVNLNVRIIGKGFKKGAVAKWLVTGSETDLGGVTVNSTTYISATDLIANITVASDAQTTKKFDIKVTLSSGRTGKGIEKFAVIYNPPDPAIVYLSDSNTIKVMNEDGSNQTVVLHTTNPKGSQGAAPLYSPSWSPDSSKVVFECSIQGNGIYVINRDGSGFRKVIALNNGSSFSDPAWSPAPAADGQWKIAFADPPPGQTRRDLFLVNLDGTGLVNLTNSPDRAEYWPTWDPYATRLAAQLYPSPNSTPELYEYDLGLVNGAVRIVGETNLTASGPLHGAWVFRPQWAKTQDKIVVDGRPLYSDPSDLWVIDLADPGNPVNLTNINTTGGGGTKPTWSTDDSKILFWGMFTINSDGTGRTYLGVEGSRTDWRRCCPTCATTCAP